MASPWVTAIHYNSGTTANTSQTITVPAGTLTSHNVVLFICTATSTAGSHSMTGTTGSGTLAVPTGGLSGQSMGTSGKLTTLTGTGHAAGDVLTIANPASGITTAVLFVLDATVTFDACGTPLTSGGTTTQTMPAVVTGAANCYVYNLACGLQTSSRNFSSLTPGTLKDHLDAAGGNVRWTAFGIGELLVASAGSSGTVSNTWSGTLSVSGGIQISFKPVAVVAGDNPGWGIAL